jgi:LacI family transcriptional regulator
MRKQTQITLSDLATRLQVSKVTISKALRDHPDIAPDTKQRIRELAEELGYTPNSAARNLSTRHTQTIGLVVPKIAHFFFSSVIESVYDTAFENNYEIILTVSQEDAAREIKHLKTLLSMRVDGLLISVSQQTQDTAIFDLVKKKGVPLVFFDRVFEDFGFSTVTVDDREGTARLVEQAIAAGYTKIAHVAGFSHTSIGRERSAGFRGAMQKHGLPLREEWIVTGGFSEDYGYQALQQFYHANNLPEVIVAVTYPVALGVYAAAKELGLKIPDDLDVVCFGDSSANRFISPSITCVSQPTEKLGRQAMEILLEEIKNPGPDLPQKIVLQTELQLRETCRASTNLAV